MISSKENAEPVNISAFAVAAVREPMRQPVISCEKSPFAATNPVQTSDHANHIGFHPRLAPSIAGIDDTSRLGANS
jgi:hypothetical protein